jgi:hypothetical protein
MKMFNDSGCFLCKVMVTKLSDNPDIIMIRYVNTIANYYRSIIPYLDSAGGSILERCNDSDKFE